MKSGWKKYLLYASLVIVGGGLLLGVFQAILAGYFVDWTGFGEYTPTTPDVERGKTLWDWMELLIIPLFLASGVFFLNRSEKEIERKAIEKRAKLERELASDHQQEAALQAYLDRMSELLLKENLRTTPEVQDIARVRTLSVLRSLEASVEVGEPIKTSIRKGEVIMFLFEAGLISTPKPIIDLSGAKLTGINLYGAVLEGVDLKHVSLAGAMLNDAKLTAANLTNSFLFGTDLRNTNLSNANLANTVIVSDSIKGANLEGVNLTHSQIIETDLTGVNLTGADLTDAYLRDSKLTSNQLASVKSLKGATMPDGTIHE